jgi:hypothetical protein
MPNENTMTRDEGRRQALRLEAMLDMFEEDRGRSAASMEELRDWMGAQYVDRLQLRMDRRLKIISHAHRLDPGESTVALLCSASLAVGRIGTVTKHNWVHPHAFRRSNRTALPMCRLYHAHGDLFGRLF